MNMRQLILLLALFVHSVFALEFRTDPRRHVATYMNSGYLIIEGQKPIHAAAGKCDKMAEGVYYKHTYSVVRVYSGKFKDTTFTLYDDKSGKSFWGRNENYDNIVVLCKGKTIKTAYTTICISELEECTGLSRSAVFNLARTVCENKKPINMSENQLDLFEYFRLEIRYDSLANISSGKIMDAGAALITLKNRFSTEYLGDHAYRVNQEIYKGRNTWHVSEIPSKVSAKPQKEPYAFDLSYLGRQLYRIDCENGKFLSYYLGGFRPNKCGLNDF